MTCVQPAGLVPQWCPSVNDIDALELLRAGVLQSHPDIVRSVTTGLEITDRDVVGALHGSDSVVEIVDSEGVPIARASTVNVDSTVHVTEISEWLGYRSSRPFERLHLPPDRVEGSAPTLLIDSGTSIALVDTAASHAPNLRVVMLASVAGDGSGETARAIRAVGQSLVSRPDAQLLVVPIAHPNADSAAAIGAAYAHGGEVTHAWGGEQPLPRQRNGAVVLFTGLSGSGKSTVARSVRDHMIEFTDQTVSLLDGDEVRRHLSAGLSFSKTDRETNIARIGWVAAEIAHHGGLAICSPIAPFAQTREKVRALAHARGGNFVLVHVATPLAECERRDRKGLYRRARAGLIPDFTGISSPYEAPDNADLVIDTSQISIAEARDRVLALLQPLLAGGR